MTNKLFVIINSLKVTKIKKMLLYETKFLVRNYSCLQNPWLGGYRPHIPVLPVLNWICWTPPPHTRTKSLGTPLEWLIITEMAGAWKDISWSFRCNIVVFTKRCQESRCSFWDYRVRHTWSTAQKRYGIKQLAVKQFYVVLSIVDFHM